MIIRVFIALEIPEAPLSEVLKIRDQHFKDVYKIKWEPVEKLHLTLKFLGDTEDSLIEKLTENIKSKISESAKLQLSFSEFGVFKKDNKPRILWLGVKENEALNKLAKDIDDICSMYGFQKETRKFNSHITLLRIKNEENINSILSMLKVKLPEINFTADKITIFKSELMSNGSKYTQLKSFYI